MGSIPLREWSDVPETGDGLRNGRPAAGTEKQLPDPRNLTPLKIISEFDLISVRIEKKMIGA